MSKTNFPAWLALKHRGWVLGFFVVATLILGWFVQYFRIDASADTLLAKGNQLYIQTQQMDKRFNPQEFVLVAYKPKNHALFSQQTFDDIQSLSAELKTIPRVQSVTHILNVPLLSQIGNLQGQINPDDWTWQHQHYSPEKMAQIFKDHPLFTDLLVNKDTTAIAIQVVFKDDPALRKFDDQITELQTKQLNDSFTDADADKLEQLKQQADPLRQQLNKTRAAEIEQIYSISEKYQDRAQLYLGGAQVLGHELVSIISDDLKTFGSAIAIAICVMLFILFGHWRWVMLPMLCCGISVICTMGLFGLLDLRTTVISSNFIALQLILTLAIVVHLIVQYRILAKATPDATQHDLLQETLAQKTRPCLYAGITTCVGFGSLIFSGLQPVMSFGWMMIIAMAMSLLVSLLLFPAVLSWFKPDAVKQDNRLSRKLVGVAERICMSAPKTVLSIGLITTLACIGGLLQLNVENSFLNYFKDDTRVHEQLSFIDQEFGGSTPLDIVINIPDQPDPHVVLSARTMQRLQALQTVLRQYPAAGNITSVHNFTELAVRINDGKPLTEYELTAIYRMIDSDLRDRLLGAYYDPTHQQLRISTRIKDSTPGLNRAEMLQNLRTDIEANGVDKQDYTLTNLFVLYQDILQRLYESQILTLGIVYAALFLVLWYLFGRLGVALVALIPNVLCTLMILALMGYLQIPLDLMTITMSAIAMGIAVDDTIHFVHHYLHEKTDPDTAIKHAFRHVGFAMLYTTGIIAIGFSLLSFSDFVPSILFGLLTAAAMLLALLTDLTLLPVMLRRWIKPGAQSA